MDIRINKKVISADDLVELLQWLTEFAENVKKDCDKDNTEYNQGQAFAFYKVIDSIGDWAIIHGMKIKPDLIEFAERIAGFRK